MRADPAACAALELSSAFGAEMTLGGYDMTKHDEVQKNELDNDWKGELYGS
ncbi:MAG: hypothetical protein HY298_25505 [Verrucomicrobia bacterium]|nr:hypothetical protein [Verrucomicrobiota bacterium]